MRRRVYSRKEVEYEYKTLVFNSERDLAAVTISSDIDRLLNDGWFMDDQFAGGRYLVIIFSRIKEEEEK